MCRRAIEERLIGPPRTIRLGLRGSLHAQELRPPGPARDGGDPGRDDPRAGSRLGRRAPPGAPGAGGSTAPSTSTPWTRPWPPATGTPEVGGLTSYRALALLRVLGAGPVGFDPVEAAPQHDGPGQITALLAASLLFAWPRPDAGSERGSAHPLSGGPSRPGRRAAVARQRCPEHATRCPHAPRFVPRPSRSWLSASRISSVPEFVFLSREISRLSSDRRRGTQSPGLATPPAPWSTPPGAGQREGQPPGSHGFEPEGPILLKVDTTQAVRSSGPAPGLLLAFSGLATDPEAEWSGGPIIVARPRRQAAAGRSCCLTRGDATPYSAFSGSTG